VLSFVVFQNRHHAPDPAARESQVLTDIYLIVFQPSFLLENLIARKSNRKRRSASDTDG
jgi:hypothetical protein